MVPDTSQLGASTGAFKFVERLYKAAVLLFIVTLAACCAAAPTGISAVWTR